MVERSSDDRPEQNADRTSVGGIRESSEVVGGPADEQSRADGELTPGNSDQTLGGSDRSDGADSAGARLRRAAERDVTAHARDRAADARDRAADARDLLMAQLDADYEHDGERAVTGAEVVIRAAEQRRRAARYRAQASAHRAHAAADRQVGARDRDDGARDRLRALADREALARALAITETDALTGARTRAAGLRDLEREVERCRRTGSCLVVAYIDAVGLKQVNDSDGHDAGDAMLKRIVAAIRWHVRTYDLIMRLGGDEFACAMSNVAMADARKRFSAIASALDASSDAIRTGFAELTGSDTAAELIARADSQLIDRRRD